MAEHADAAIAKVRASADAGRLADDKRLRAVLGARADSSFVERLVSGMRSNCRLTLNFHPDRRMADGASVAHGLLSTGEYRPQSLTGLSNGGRYVPGGERTQWEGQLFGDAYTNVGARRPVYGALDLTNDPFGGSPRFGSCFFVLASHCFDRATMCVGDSHVGPTDIGTIDSPTALLAGLFEASVGGNALDRGLDVDGLVSTLIDGHQVDEPARDLDHYVEAQVHGLLHLERDVDAVVVDPSFRDTDTHTVLSEAADTFGIALFWHRGSRLRVADIPDDFRGPGMRPLATNIVGPDGVLDAAALGRSAAAIPYVPPSIQGDPPEGPLQQHKRLWHCLLRFGR